VKRQNIRGFTKWEILTISLIMQALRSMRRQLAHVYQCPERESGKRGKR
jgi:hypothetical protein